MLTLAATVNYHIRFGPTPQIRSVSYVPALSPLWMKPQQALPGSTPRISCRASSPSSHSSRTLPTRLITCFIFFAVTPGSARNSSSAAAFTPAPASASSSAPTSTARPGSGSGAFALRSLNTSAVAYGDDDQSTRTRGNVNVSSTSFAWMDCAALLFAAAPSTRGSAFFFGGYLLDLAYDLTSVTA